MTLLFYWYSIVVNRPLFDAEMTIIVVRPSLIPNRRGPVPWHGSVSEHYNDRYIDLLTGIEGQWLVNAPVSIAENDWRRNSIPNIDADIIGVAIDNTVVLIMHYWLFNYWWYDDGVIVK